MNIIFVQFVYHKQYGDITELKKYSVDGGNKAHHLSCKSCDPEVLNIAGSAHSKVPIFRYYSNTY